MLTHNTHYATDDESCKIVGYAVYDIKTGKFLTPKAGWTIKIAKADCLPKSVILDAFSSQPRYRPHPILDTDNNYMVAHVLGCV